MRGACLFFTLLLCVFPLGCGSKISEANYYRVQYGMSEEDVEDLLGPSHAESGEYSPPAIARDDAATSRPVRVSRSWSRGPLVIKVSFENGVVVGRSAEGIPAELNWSCATRPTSQASAHAG